MTLSEPLPGKNPMLAACRGDANNDHPLLRSARELAELHELRLGASRERADEIDHERTRLVREIDCWVTGQLPPSLGAARVHTETIGAVVDRLGQFTACAFAALASGSNWELGDAWERLAELAIGYEDLKDEVSVGRRRLPGGP
ncbi:DUF4254 domain-containing protein [Nocardia sp. GCM10030253]|uniref:DUF4254 domain-containing protein n=1 Tax=Nocardia sp. GCM10030253 TaxID=3273404 RepID=UPI0036325E87